MCPTGVLRARIVSRFATLAELEFYLGAHEHADTGAPVTRALVCVNVRGLKGQTASVAEMVAAMDGPLSALPSLTTVTLQTRYEEEYDVLKRYLGLLHASGRLVWRRSHAQWWRRHW